MIILHSREPYKFYWRRGKDRSKAQARLLRSSTSLLYSYTTASAN